MEPTQEQSRSSAQLLARQVALDVADEDGQVGDFVNAIEMPDHVVDFRFACLIRGYEGWQWSVTMYNDVDRGLWSVDESSLVPTDQALRPPTWVPWKDRLRASDLSVTDSIGTDPEDARLEDGFRATDASTGATAQQDTEVTRDAVQDAATDGSGDSDDSQVADARGDSGAPSRADDERTQTEEIVEEYALSRRHVLSELGRSQTAKRWYEGPHGPKSLSTRTADGKVCANCGFFVPLQGELGTMFGVCANLWGPDDGRVVSLDHGCGEHSDIDPPEPSHLWEQSEPAFDDLHIDVVAQSQREERGDVELLEMLSDTEPSTEPDTKPNTDKDSSDNA